ncbi:uncharacterized protein LOC105216948 isoform X1 [Zeugodacus cucurbitae]|uniref:uncharacterized protein LOC105216948 isoform X1 n=1 Tax=Zeugodacus cucurbitae TaxID=28588 RepID=UPI0023D94CF0|nr:uncharacterized protein LOC105216948 isoform X1 [Zeugodacus cucurbitae]
MLTDFQELWPASRRNTIPKNNELQSINVVKTCEKLRLALTRACNGLQRTQDISHRHTTEQLSFRSISQLCYTTLRIHELQVNDLLRKSKELISQSKDWCTVKQAKKRSQPTSYSSAYCAKRKRRRATVEHSLPDGTVTDYTELLDETATFVEWGKTTEIVQKKVSKTNNHSRTTCIHIREITINEFDTTHNEHYPIDEDDGFGNATGDELATIIQLLTGKVCMFNMKFESKCLIKIIQLDESTTKAPKRKAAAVLAVCEKKAKTTDALLEVEEFPDEIEAPRSANAEYETTNLFIPAAKNDCDNSNVNELSAAHTEMSVISSNVSVNNDNYVAIHTSCNLDKTNTTAIATENLCNYQKKLVSHLSLKKRKSKHNKTIIDASTAFTESEIYAHLQTQINIKAKLSKSRAKVNWQNRKYPTVGKHYEKLLPSASELLTTLHHNCIVHRKFKLKHNMRRSNLETSTARAAYRNLLREILNCEITDDLATKIYPKWNHNEKRKRKSVNNALNYGLTENAQVQQDDTHNEHLLMPHNNTAAIEVFHDNNNNLQRTNNNCSPSGEQDEWGAYDVMIKLLNMWRSQILLNDEIPVELLFPQATMCRKAAAKCFGALLRLAANGFIMLSTVEHSTHLQYIKLGAASNKLIQRTELNNEMVSNGFRVSVS